MRKAFLFLVLACLWVLLGAWYHMAHSDGVEVIRLPHGMNQVWDKWYGDRETLIHFIAGGLGLTNKDTIVVRVSFTLVIGRSQIHPYGTLWREIDGPNMIENSPSPAALDYEFSKLAHR